MPDRPDLLLLTHGHADHAGGAGRLTAAGTPVAAGALTAQWLGAADEGAVSLHRARRAGIYPPDYRLAACTGIRVLEDGESLAFGRARIEARVDARAQR